jgi:RimJ/RimL family protein N-acetyltransferase
MMHLRKANINDAEIMFYWRNDPTARHMSNNNEELDYAHHYQWLKNALTDPNVLLWIGKDKHLLIGYFRVNIDTSDDAPAGIVSVCVDPRHRRKGYGTLMVQEGIKQPDLSSVALRAIVHDNNAPSIKVFRRAGFIGRHPKSTNYYVFELLK